MSLSDEELDLYKILNDNSPYVQKELKEEIFALGQSLKQKMDQGLSVDDIGKYQSLYNATQVALSVVDDLM